GFVEGIDDGEADAFGIQFVPVDVFGFGFQGSGGVQFEPETVCFMMEVGLITASDSKTAFEVKLVNNLEFAKKEEKVVDFKLCGVRKSLVVRVGIKEREGSRGGAVEGLEEMKGCQVGKTGFWFFFLIN
ncbi:hypothetical protein DVH24_016102, partial [Malus domestica]